MSAVSAFFLPYTRFWELISGGVVGSIFSYKKSYIEKIRLMFDGWIKSEISLPKSELYKKQLNNIISLAGVFVIAYGFYRVHDGLEWPGIWATVPVVGTILIILAGDQAWFNRVVLSNRIVVWFGLISFPLYLWHWPLLTFAKIFEGEEPGKSVRIIIIVFSIVLAWFTYLFIERRIRLGSHQKSKVFALVIIMIVVGCTGWVTYYLKGINSRSIAVMHRDFEKGLEWPLLKNPKCTEKFGISPCQYSYSPLRLMILGDSHGRHLYPGFTRLVKEGFGIFSGGSCAPAMGIKMFVNKKQAGHTCGRIDYLAQNMKILDANPSIKTVVLSAFWGVILDGYLKNEKERKYYGGIRIESSYQGEKGLPSEELLYRGLKRTISELKYRDKDVVFVRDTPNYKSHIRDNCLKRFGLLQIQECQVPRIELESDRIKENLLIDKLKADFVDLMVVDPFDIFCDNKNCFLTIGAKPLYRDQHHLSVYGSEYLVKKMINKYLKDLAR